METTNAASLVQYLTDRNYTVVKVVPGFIWIETRCEYLLECYEAAAVTERVAADWASVRAFMA